MKAEKERKGQNYIRLFQPGSRIVQEVFHVSFWLKGLGLGQTSTELGCMLT